MVLPAHTTACSDSGGMCVSRVRRSVSSGYMVNELPDAACAVSGDARKKMFDFVNTSVDQINRYIMNSCEGSNVR